MQFELMASMMCANYGNLEQEVRDLEAGGIDSFHIDIMDGRFVANFAMSLNDMSYIAKATSKPLDVHLMIEHPNNRVGLFLKNLRPGDTVYIHPEAEYHPSTTLQFVRNNFMVGIKYNSLADLNGQALAWCNKVNGKVHATTNEIPFERLKKEGLSPLTCEYIIDKINLRRVQKDCLISYAGNQYSAPAEYVGKDAAVVALDSMLAAYYEGKQIALYRISYQRKDMVVNPQHYRRLTLKQTMDAENVLLEQGKVIDFPLKPSDLSRYDELLYE